MGDYYNTIHAAAEAAEKRGHAAGLAEGFEKGRKQGIEEAIKTVADNLLKNGMSVVEVAALTGLSQEELNRKTVTTIFFVSCQHSVCYLVKV